MFCLNEIDHNLNKLEQGYSVFSSFPIDKYIDCAKKHNLTTQYFSVIDSGFIVFKDKTIILISEEGGTRLSIKPI